MSLKYTIFGIPDNLEEFIDKIQRKRITAVEISTETENLSGYPIGRNEFGETEYTDQIYQYTIIIAGRYKLKLTDQKHSYSRSSHSSEGIWHMFYYNRLFYQRAALDIAEKFAKEGIQANFRCYFTWDTFDQLNSTQAKEVNKKTKEKLLDSLPKI